MAIELKVPAVGESITEVELGEWLIDVGGSVAQDATVVMIETDKVTAELPAPVNGKVTKILKHAGDIAQVGEVIGYMEEGAALASSSELIKTKEAPAKVESVSVSQSENLVMPAARRVLGQAGVDSKEVAGSGRSGRVLKEDAMNFVSSEQKSKKAPAVASKQVIVPQATLGPREEKLVRMTSLRRKVAEHLVQATQETAMLTTFNEIDMSPVMELRARHKDAFQNRFGVKLGFMSFFVRAVVDALRRVPALNAEIRGDMIAYRDFYDIGVAVGGGKGLVVPVLRNAEGLGFAEIEKKIADFGQRAKDNKITLEDLQGGTFTITNGGIYGSLMSTPILNRPQSGILGMHAIKDRAVVVDGKVEARPMMYVALSYDHRLVDGREAVTFLVRIKECLENPSRMLLEI